MFLVGLTGGIATGKSTVSAIFQENNIPIIDADKIAYSVVEPGKPAYLKLREEFGSGIFDDENGGVLIREKLGQMVFSDPEVRKKVNSITHPLIRKEIKAQIWKHFCSGARFVLLDLPFTKEQQLTRLQKRNNYDEETAQKRIAAQMPLEQKVQRATHVVNNSGSPEDTRAQVEAIIAELKSSNLYLIVRGFIVTVGLLTVLAAGCIISYL
ncbi:unnamed protein product [Enterobius vermicularis]|uniref:Dephospho-CoA kinase domain-containing protein n=1 Tax=Enterobius vermicularis TaxID=51028 RepID=A0A0N4VFC9_ENTVE|nr:unnamed protein product [Enterobius vermicularis]